MSLIHVVVQVQLVNKPVVCQNGSSSVHSSQEVRPVHKRIRILSDSESEASPVKLDLPLADDIEKKVSFLQNAYPDIDPMVLQDTLK